MLSRFVKLKIVTCNFCALIKLAHSQYFHKKLYPTVQLMWQSPKQPTARSVIVSTLFLQSVLSVMAHHLVERWNHCLTASTYLVVSHLPRWYAISLIQAHSCFSGSKCTQYHWNCIWPTNSFNLNPCSYSVWEAIQQLVYRQKIRDLKHLKDILHSCWDTTGQDLIDSAMD